MSLKYKTDTMWIIIYKFVICALKSGNTVKKISIHPFYSCLSEKFICAFYSNNIKNDSRHFSKVIFFFIIKIDRESMAASGESSQNPQKNIFLLPFFALIQLKMRHFPLNSYRKKRATLQKVSHRLIDFSHPRNPSKIERIFPRI